MRMRLLVVLAFAGALVGGGTGSGASTAACSASGPTVCVDLVGTPATIPPSGETPHFVSYISHISNDGNQTATHVTADIDLSGGLALESVTSSAGSCSVGGQPTCVLGRLASGAGATLEFVARAPQAEAEATATVTVSFDERTNDGPTADPKQDTVATSEATSVATLSGAASSFVPEGASVTLTTDPTDTGVATPADPLIGGAVITTASRSVTASIDEVAVPLACPKKVVCPAGDWFHADIPGTFDPPMAFPLRWDSTLVPNSLNAKKFALVYTACLDGCPLEIISTRCSTANPAAGELPCLTGVAKVDGDIVATLISDHNGWMK